VSATRPISRADIPKRPSTPQSSRTVAGERPPGSSSLRQALVQTFPSRFDRVVGPRRPVLRRAIAGIASDRISETGTGVRRIGRRALISIARTTGVRGLSRAAWRSRGRGSGVGRVSQVVWRSVTPRRGKLGVPSSVGIHSPEDWSKRGIRSSPDIHSPAARSLNIRRRDTRKQEVRKLGIRSRCPVAEEVY
jgi:hypothetical protein